MCRLKIMLYCLVCFLIFSPLCICYGSSSQINDDFSRRITVQESLDECICTIYQIRSGDLTQEEGLDQLENMLDMIKFISWFWIED